MKVVQVGCHKKAARADKECSVKDFLVRSPIDVKVVQVGCHKKAARADKECSVKDFLVR